jgi:3-mercaptopyruvate sulfurtransferase SseA
MQRIKRIFFGSLAFVAVLAACSAQPTQIQPTATPAQVIESGQGVTPEGLPQSEADVPRVSIEEAKAALDSGLAVIVDVRSPSDFEASHIAGAISVPLEEIERNPTDLALDENQWIITYCT